MKVLQPEEYNKLDFHSKRHSKNTPVYEQLKELQVREGLLLLEKEWSGKSLPGDSMHSYFAQSEAFKGKKFSIKTVRKPKGWLIIRVL